MIIEKLTNALEQVSISLQTQISQPGTYIQLGMILAVYAISIIIANRIRKYVPFFHSGKDTPATQPVHKKFLGRLGLYIAPVLAIFILKIMIEMDSSVAGHLWIKKTALTLGILYLFYSIVRDFVSNRFISAVLLWVVLPILFMHLLDILEGIILILESISLSVGNIEISAYGIVRVALFGSLLFWLGRATNKTGVDIIRKQEKLDLRTKEVAAKLFEIGIFTLISLLLLQIMGINLTALAVFGGAIGVGLGFGLQKIASNFISGVILLIEGQATVGDYVELDGGEAGRIIKMAARATILETFDGRWIVVPNEDFITTRVINYSDSGSANRYEADFSVSYDTDINLVPDIIEAAVEAAISHNDKAA